MNPNKNHIRSHRPDCPCPPCLNMRRKGILASGGSVPPPPANEKQKRLANVIVNSLVNGTPVSAKTALLEAGYGSSQLYRPDKILDRESFRLEALRVAAKKKLDLPFLISVLKQLCRAERGIYMKDKSGEIVRFAEADNQARGKALELAMKMYNVLPGDSAIGGDKIMIIHSSAVLTPGHSDTCECQTCMNELEKMAERCREQVSRTPESSETGETETEGKASSLASPETDEGK